MGREERGEGKMEERRINRYMEGERKKWKRGGEKEGGMKEEGMRWDRWKKEEEEGDGRRAGGRRAGGQEGRRARVKRRWGGGWMDGRRKE
jgi:hypothetical protein